MGAGLVFIDAFQAGDHFLESDFSLWCGLLVKKWLNLLKFEHKICVSHAHDLDRKEMRQHVRLISKPLLGNP